jgi:divalent metal cation (Fe/Co/Zn/Cd) transporter
MRKFAVLVLLFSMVGAVFAEAPWDFLRPGIQAVQALGIITGAVVFIISLALFGIAVKAYKKSGSPKLRVVCAAFGLFALKLLLTLIDLVVSPGYFMSPPVQNIFDLAILAAFFTALFRK